MGFVNDDEVPVGEQQVRQDLVALGEVNGRDRAVGLPPGVAAELPVDLPRVENVKPLVELVVELFALGDEVDFGDRIGARERVTLPLAGGGTSIPTSRSTPPIGGFKCSSR